MFSNAIFASSAAITRSGKIVSANILPKKSSLSTIVFTSRITRSISSILLAILKDCSGTRPILANKVITVLLNSSKISF